MSDILHLAAVFAPPLVTLVALLFVATLAGKARETQADRNAEARAQEHDARLYHEQRALVLGLPLTPRRPATRRR